MTPPHGVEWITPQVPGLGSNGTSSEWTLQGCADQLRTKLGDIDAWVGHDLGGVLAAMLAKPGQPVVLSGTALSLYWWAIRQTARPGLQRYFYQRHAGRRFLEHGALPAHREALVEAFLDHGGDWGDRMCWIARGMRPPKGLASKLSECDVHLFWGRRDPWYPAPVVWALRRSTGARVRWFESGHFVPWEAADEFSGALEGVSEVR